jgi:branched-chain amino acid transport system substrate-binding protein
VIAEFGSSELNATTAAIIYQEDDPYSKGLASDIKAQWENLHGNGSVVAYVSFNNTNIEKSDYGDQAAEIATVNETAGVLFVPVKGKLVPYVVNAVRDAGVQKLPIVGGDAWNDDVALKKCGEACVGSYFTSNFIASGAVGYAKHFADQYTSAYGYMPESSAALAYDAMNLIKAGLEQYGTWTCDLAQNRDGLRKGMKKLTNFQGVGGNITFDKNRNPKDKCINIAHVINASNTASSTFFSLYCPANSA